MRWLSRLVSMLMIVALVLGLVLYVRSKMPATKVGESFTTCAAFRDGSKLSPGSPVLIAGVRVGEISGLRIDGALARIELRLRDDTQLPVDSWITKRAFSPFGDSYVEIIPGGPDEEGAPTVQMLRSGECLHRVAEGASTDRILRQLDKIMPDVEDGLERLHEVGEYGRKWTAGTLAEGIIDVDHWLDEENIARPLRSADQALDRLEKATTGAAKAVAGAKPQIGTTMTRLERGLGDARKQMAQVQIDLRDGFQTAREGMNGGDDPIKDFEELLAAVDEGRGSDSKGQLGRLINDPKLGNDIEDAADAGREAMSTFTRFKSWLGLRVEFNVFSRQPRFYLSAEVRARTDKFYLVELAKGPEGDFPNDQVADATATGTWNRRQEIKDRLRFTAQFGKTYGNWFQIRAGLKESTFGAGTDFLVGNGRLKLSADLFGGYSRTPRLKLAGALAVFRSIYVIAGIDDALNSPGYLNIRPDPTDVPIAYDQVRFGRDYFFGATLHFDDADLSILLRMYGALLVSLL